MTTQDGVGEHLNVAFTPSLVVPPPRVGSMPHDLEVALGLVADGCYGVGVVVAAIVDRGFRVAVAALLAAPADGFAGVKGALICIAEVFLAADRLSVALTFDRSKPGLFLFLSHVLISFLLL